MLWLAITSLAFSIFAVVYSTYFALRTYNYIKKQKQCLEEYIAQKAEDYVKGHVLTVQHQQAQLEKAVVADTLDVQTNGLFSVIEAVSPRFAKKLVQMIRRNPELLEVVASKLKQEKSVGEW